MSQSVGEGRVTYRDSTHCVIVKIVIPSRSEELCRTPAILEFRNLKMSSSILFLFSTNHIGSVSAPVCPLVGWSVVVDIDVNTQ